MEPAEAIGTIAAAFVGGVGGAWLAADRSAKATERAASTAAESALSVAGMAAESARTVADATRDAERRAWINERSRDIVDDLLVAADRHYRQVGAQMRRRQEAAQGKADPATIPPVDSTDPIRELVWRLSFVADEAVVAAGFRLYRASVRADAHNYRADRHLHGGAVTALSNQDLHAINRRLITIVETRDEFRNAFRAQLGQPPLVDPPPLTVDDE